MSTYKLAEGLYLWKDGVMTVCPIANSILYPKFSKETSKSDHFTKEQKPVAFEIKRFPCTIKCPHFDFETKINRDNVEIHEFTMRCVIDSPTHAIEIETAENQMVPGEKPEPKLKIKK